MKVSELLYRIYIVLIFLPIFLVTTVITAVVTAVGSILGGAKVFAYWPGKIWSIITLATLLCPVTVRGRNNIPRDRNVIVVPNHTSALDVFLLYGYMHGRFKWVMKGSLRNIPFVGWACKKAGFIFVDNTREGAIQVIKDTKAAVQNGYHVYIFPEGSRTWTGELGRLKKGAFKVAIDTETPLQPVKIKGGFEAFKRNACWPKRKHLSLEIFPLIEVTKDSNIHELMRKVEDKIK